MAAVVAAPCRALSAAATQRRRWRRPLHPSTAPPPPPPPPPRLTTPPPPSPPPPNNNTNNPPRSSRSWKSARRCPSGLTRSRSTCPSCRASRRRSAPRSAGWRQRRSAAPSWSRTRRCASTRSRWVRSGVCGVQWPCVRVWCVCVVVFGVRVCCDCQLGRTATPDAHSRYTIPHNARTTTTFINTCIHTTGPAGPLHQVVPREARPRRPQPPARCADLQQTRVPDEGPFAPRRGWRGGGGGGERDALATLSSKHPRACLKTPAAAAITQRPRPPPQQTIDPPQPASTTSRPTRSASSPTRPARTANRWSSSGAPTAGSCPPGATTSSAGTLFSSRRGSIRRMRNWTRISRTRSATGVNACMCVCIAVQRALCV